MSHRALEWSPAKAASHLKQHGVSVEKARTACEDAEALLIPDPEHSVNEERFVLLGVSGTSRLLVVIHCARGPAASGRRLSMPWRPVRSDAVSRALHQISEA